MYKNKWTDHKLVRRTNSEIEAKQPWSLLITLQYRDYFDSYLMDTHDPATDKFVALMRNLTQ